MLETQFGNRRQSSIRPGFPGSPRARGTVKQRGGCSVEEFIAKEAISDRTL